MPMKTLRLFCIQSFLTLCLGLFICQGTTLANSNPDDACAEVLNVSITLDANADEISWTLINTDIYNKVADGEYYTLEDNFETVSTSVCVLNGCYEFTIYDSWGDGIACQEEGDHITITTESGENILLSNGQFEDFINIEFCIDQNGITLQNKV